MLANYEVEMLTGNGGDGGDAASEVIKRKEEKGCRTGKNGRERDLIEYLNRQALLLLKGP